MCDAMLRIRILRSGCLDTKSDNLGFCKELLYAKRVVKDINTTVMSATMIVIIWF